MAPNSAMEEERRHGRRRDGEGSREENMFVGISGDEWLREEEQEKIVVEKRRRRKKMTQGVIEYTLHNRGEVDKQRGLFQSRLTDEHCDQKVK